MKKKIYLFILSFLALGFFAQAQNIQFEDAKFKAKLLSATPQNWMARDVNGKYVAVDADGDGEISQAEALSIGNLNITDDTGIESMKGIEYFTNLTGFGLGADVNSLKSLDLSALKKLEYFRYNDEFYDYSESIAIFRGGLSNLILPRTSTLESVDINGSLLSNLNFLSGVTGLKSLELRYMNIKNLTVSGSQFSRLENMSVSSRIPEATVTVSNLPELTHLYEVGGSYGNLNVTLSLSNLPKIESIWEYQIAAKNITIRNLPNLVSLWGTGSDGEEAKGVYMESLVLSGVPKLEYLYIPFHSMRSLDLSNVPNLVHLECMAQQWLGADGEEVEYNPTLESLNLSRNTKLIELFLHKTKLQTLDLSRNVDLEYLDLSVANLRTLDVSRNINLIAMSLDSTGIQTLVTKDINLEYLDLNREYRLETLDLSKNINLLSLDVDAPKLQALDVSKSIDLYSMKLFCPGLQTLDVSKNIGLRGLSLWCPGLQTLDVSKNTTLTKLWFIDCSELTSLYMGNGVQKTFGNGYNFSGTNLNFICCGENEVDAVKDYMQTLAAAGNAMAAGWQFSDLTVDYDCLIETTRHSVENSNNDAQENLATGAVSLTGTSLYLGGMNGSASVTNGVKFDNIALPDGAQIVDAYIEFYSYGTASKGAKLTLKAELGNAAVYATGSRNITSRAYTERSVSWTTEAWPQASVLYRTPNLKEIIDENRLNGWKNGGSIAFGIDGDGSTANVYSRNGSSTYQPRLVIEYLNNGKGPDVGPVPEAPVTTRHYVENNNNDAQENLATGAVSLTGTSLHLGGMNGSSPVTNGVKFDNVKLPAGAQVIDAYIEFHSYGTASNGAQLTLRTELGNPAIYSTTSQNITSRTYSQRSVSWNTEAWPRASVLYRTPNLKEIIDENRLNGWTDGGSMAFGIDGDGKAANVYSRNGSSTYQPRLVIEYINNGQGPDVSPLPETTQILLQVGTGISGNDVEINSNTNTANFVSSDLELHGKDGTVPQETFVRFDGITLPADAVINQVYLIFTGKEAGSAGTVVDIKGEIGNSASYPTSTSASTGIAIKGRSYTSDLVSWTTSACAVNQKYQSPDLKGLVMEMFPDGLQGVNNASMAFRLTGNGQGAFTVYSRDGNVNYQPLLVIDYQTGTSSLSVLVTELNNDAQENLTTGAMSLTGAALYLGGINGSASVTNGVKFDNVKLPAGAQIVDAYIEFYSYGTGGKGAELTFRTELGNPAMYSSSSQNITSRTYSQGSVVWNTESWTRASVLYRTPNLKDIIDENRLNGWTDGQSLAFRIEGNKVVTNAYSRNGSSTYQPRLVIKYLNNGQGPLSGASPSGTVAEVSNTTLHTPLLDGMNDTGFTLYPNPASSELHIDIDNHPADSKTLLYIYNAAGALEMTKALDGEKNVVNVSQLSPGYHLVKVVNDKGTTKTFRLIKL